MRVVPATAFYHLDRFLQVTKNTFFQKQFSNSFWKNFTNNSKFFRVKTFFVSVQNFSLSKKFGWDAENFLEIFPKHVSKRF
jgi:hypothetical protein